MPCRPRVHLDGVPLHIVQRGHNREACFLAEEDYHTYLHWLRGAGGAPMPPARRCPHDQPRAPSPHAEEDRSRSWRRSARRRSREAGRGR